MLDLIVRRLASDKVIINLKKVYPAWEIEQRVREYYAQKIKTVLGILIMGILVCILITIDEKNNSLTGNGEIKRNDYGHGKKDVTLNYRLDDYDESGTISFEVSEKKYTDSEIKEMLPGFKDELIKQILSDNTSPDYVASDLKLVDSVENYPFSVSYRTSNPMLISKEGQINQDYMRDLGHETEVEIDALISYFDYEEEWAFFVSVYERELSRSELINRNLNEYFVKENMNSANTDYIRLPEEALGARVTFSENRSEKVLIVACLFAFASIAAFVAKDKELEKETEKRRNELLNDYPDLVNRFTLFYNAGMPVKAVWMKICNDYAENRENGGDKRILYEEMSYTKMQILGGMSEMSAYEDFAKRIGIRKYSMFINLLEQAITIGRNDLAQSLRRECEDAYLDKKNNAKKLLEEAGTKMLIPMFMMLGVVIIIILFPAFYSFNM